MGNSFSLSYALTVGVVSAIGHIGVGINDYEYFIQTDVAINPVNTTNQFQLELNATSNDRHLFYCGVQISGWRYVI